MLVVEDEAAILKLITRILSTLGYTVLTAQAPALALKTAQDHTGKIDLLITDVVMPEMTGRDLSVRLLSVYPDLKVLYMSGYTADVIAHRGILETGAQFIQKPFNKDELARKIRDALSE